jgi:hypothetical protein
MSHSFNEYREKLLKKIKESTDIDYIKLPFEKANQILRQTFESLNSADFKQDNILLNFYNRWRATNENITKNREQGIKYKKATDSRSIGTKQNSISTAEFSAFRDFYTQNAGRLESDILAKPIDLYSFYMSSISPADNINETIIKVCSYIYPDGELVVDTKKVMSVLSTFLQNSYIIEESSLESPNDQNLIDMMEKSLIEEVNADGIHYIKHTNEKELRREHLREIAADTYKFCDKMSKNEQISSILKLHYISSNNYDFSHAMDKIIESKHYSKGKSNTESANIKVLNTSSILEAYNNSSALLVLSNSRLLAGGGTDMGIETNETKTMLSTSLLYTLQTCEDIQFPLDYDRLMYFPKVCVFRNFAHPNFTMFSSKNVKNISILSCSPPFRPKTNIADLGENNSFDSRLYEESAYIIDEVLIIKKIAATFEVAAKLKFGTIIWDDWGIIDFWLPLNQIAKIFATISKEYADQFDNIIFAIDTPQHYHIFKKHILD